MAKRTLTTSLVCLSAMALVAGCAGSSMEGSYPSKSGGGYDAPTAEAGGDYGDEAAEAPSFQQAPMTTDAAPAPSPGGGAGRSADRSEAEAAPRDDDPFALKREKSRPGLATQWGEQRFSRVTTAPFVRADSMSPFAVSKVFYNDPEGIAAMSDTLGGRRTHTRRFSVGSGHIEIGLRDSNGRFLTGFEANGDNFVTGIAGQRYTIFVKNHSPGRIEAVVSVDGLDVIDGKSASFTKRGYLLDPFGDVEIEGFRTSTSEVASFRFGSVEQSYANKKTGDTRNVGVIGLAMFHERGDSPRFWGTPRSHDDVVNRQGADPFPNRFAAPPN